MIALFAKLLKPFFPAAKTMERSLSFLIKSEASWFAPLCVVAVRVGFIAMYGVAVETCLVMVIYMHEALNKHLSTGSNSSEDINQAAIEGAVQRLSPKFMTIAVNLMDLMPIIWRADTGSIRFRQEVDLQKNSFKEDQRATNRRRRA